MNPDSNNPTPPSEIPPVNNGVPSTSTPTPEPAPVQPSTAEQPFSPQPTPFTAPQPQSPFSQTQPITSVSDPQPDGGSNKKLFIIIGVVVAVLLAAGGTAWALSMNNSDDKKTDTSRSASFEDNNAPAALDEENKDNTPISSEKVVVNKKIEDAAMGYSVNVLSVQRNIDIKPDAKYIAFEGKVFVAVEVEADVTNRKYTGTITDGSFRLIDAAGNQITTSSAILESNIKQLGLEPFDSATSVNLVEKGVLVFAVEPDQVGSLKLRYKRAAMNELGGGAQIPAVQVDVDL